MQPRAAAFVGRVIEKHHECDSDLVGGFLLCRLHSVHFFLTKFTGAYLEMPIPFPLMRVVHFPDDTAHSYPASLRNEIVMQRLATNDGSFPNDIHLLNALVLDISEYRSHFVLMQVETLGDALNLGVSFTMRCAQGKRSGMKSIPECQFKCELDSLTLVATRGRDMPITMLKERLRCPRCGSRSLRLVFTLPSGGGRMAVGG